MYGLLKQIRNETEDPNSKQFNLSYCLNSLKLYIYLFFLKNKNGRFLFIEGNRGYNTFVYKISNKIVFYLKNCFLLKKCFFADQTFKLKPSN